MTGGESEGYKQWDPGDRRGRSAAMAPVGGTAVVFDVESGTNDQPVIQYLPQTLPFEDEVGA